VSEPLPVLLCVPVHQAVDVLAGQRDERIVGSDAAHDVREATSHGLDGRPCIRAHEDALAWHRHQWRATAHVGGDAHTEEHDVVRVVDARASAFQRERVGRERVRLLP
jgi:hypothetical protein